MARIPSIQALKAIESVGRLGTIWQAADELNLTRSAVSHQLRLLERELNFQLLTRSGNRIELSPRGLIYAEDVRKALSLIASSTVCSAQQGVAGPLTISCPAGFASSWLCLHLSAFVASNPDIVLSVVTPRRLDHAANPEIDVFITFGHNSRPDLLVEPLCGVEYTPLCTPSYFARFGGFSTARSLLEATLLHIADFADWERWMRLKGLPTDLAHRGICYSEMNVVHTAVLADQGIAIGDVVTWGDALRSGQLVRPFPEALHQDTGYFLCTPLEKLKNAAVPVFRAWLKGSMALPLPHFQAEGE